MRKWQYHLYVIYETLDLKYAFISFESVPYHAHTQLYLEPRSDLV
jgi:hypothetical protein